jgi:hypothetical protein
MNATFSISLLCPAEDRPPISHKVRDYLVQFITDELLVPNHLILDGEWNIELAMLFIPVDEFGPHQVDIYEAEIYEDSKLRSYPIAIPLDAITQSEEPYLKTIELLYEGLFRFFPSFYKQVHAHDMQDLWEKIDFDYLFSLPYPADITEQPYTGG